MPQRYELKTFESETGNLTVFENIIPGTIQRVFYIYETGSSARAGHRHHRTWNALVCVSGRCRVYVNDGVAETEFFLTNPRECLVLEPKDWHTMDSFSEDAVLLVVSNALYDKDDYIYEPYPVSCAADEIAMSGVL